MHFGVVTSHKMFFSCISTSSLSYIQRFFSKRIIVKTFLHTQLVKHTNLKNQLHISTGSPKKSFSDAVFQHFVDELKLKHCNSAMQMDLQPLVPVFLCFYSIYLVVMLPFRMIFFYPFLFLFLVNLQYFSTLLQD